MAHKTVGLLTFATAGLMMTALPAHAGTDSNRGTFGGAILTVPDVQWAGGSCMKVPVTVAADTATPTTTWIATFRTLNGGVSFSDTGTTTVADDMELCKFGRSSGAHQLSGTFTTWSKDPVGKDVLPLSATFQIFKATTTASITSLQRVGKRVDLRGRVATQANLEPGGGRVRLELKKPGKNWRTYSDRLSIGADFTVLSPRTPKRTKFRIIYEGTDLAEPATSTVRTR